MSIDTISSKDEIFQLSELYHQLLTTLAEDPNREGLLGTPGRAAKAILELTSGYHVDIDTLVNNAVYQSDCRNKVAINTIEFYSLCEHHLLPIIGTCDISYIPNGKVLGLSKFARIVDMYAKRLQIQENLTVQIAEQINQLIQPKGISVEISATHLCMSMRGVGKQQAHMHTCHKMGILL